MIPGPTNIPERVMQAMMSPMINHRGEEFHSLYRRMQANAQKVFETMNEIVILSGSGTAGVDMAVGSILNEGDSAVIPNFGEFSSRVAESAKFVGANVISAEYELGTVPSTESVDKAMSTSGNVKALFAVFNETSTGVTWRRLKELKEIATRYGALFVVDAVSVLGGEKLPVDELGIDICIAGSQKCLAAPPGLVILSFSDPAKKAMSSVKARNQYFDVPRYFKFAERAETPCTPAVSLFFAVDEALKMTLEEGLENKIRRHALCASAFYTAFESMGLKAFATPEFRSNTVIGITYPPGFNDAQFRTLLEDKFGVVVAGGFGKLKGSMFRVGSMGIVDEPMVVTTVDAISQAMSLSGYRNDSSRAVSAVLEKLRPLRPAGSVKSASGGVT
jgi:aspartate aminotransferase-like enzyme